MKKVITKVIAALFYIIVNTIIVLGHIGALKHNYELRYVYLIGVFVVPIVLGVWLHKKDRNAFLFIIIVYVFSGILLVGLEEYDMNYTHKFQVSDSILHFLGWNTEEGDEFLKSRVYGIVNILFPGIIILCSVIVGVSYFLVTKPKKKETLL